MFFFSFFLYQTKFSKEAPHHFAFHLVTLILHLYPGAKAIAQMKHLLEPPPKLHC